MSIVSSLNSLARTHFAFKRSIFTDEYLADWAAGCDKLINQIKAIEENSERTRFLHRVFYESMHLITNEYRSLLGQDGISLLGCLLVTLCANNNQISRHLVNMINYFPRQANEEPLLVELLQAIDGLQYEFSISLNEKLLTHKWTKEQLSLYKRNLISEKYHLKKYNLIFECTPGFSQIVALLYVAYNDKDRFQCVEFYVEQVHFIAGKYTLDPIRVLEIILRISSIYVHEYHEFLIKLLQLSDYWPSVTSDAYDWKMLNYGGNVIASKLLASRLKYEAFDQKYLDMTCVLIREGFVSYLSIFHALEPDDETTELYVEDYYNELETLSTEGVSNLLATAAALSDDKDPELDDAVSNGKEEPAGQEQEQSMKEREARNIKMRDTGMWALVTTCLNHGLLIPALHSIKQYERVAITIDRLIIALLRLYDEMIIPLYSAAVCTSTYSITSKISMRMSHSGLPSKEHRLYQDHLSSEVKEDFLLGEKYTFYYKNWNKRLPYISTLDDLFQYSHEILSFVGPRLMLVPSIIVKLSKIGINDIKNSGEFEKTIDKWVDYFRSFLLPAIVALEKDFITNVSVYELMAFFPFERRYFLYNEVLTKTSIDNIFVRLSFNKMKKRIRGTLKSLNIEDIQEKANEVAKLVSSNPLATLEPIVNQIENYDKVSELVIFSVIKFPNFAYDVLQYILLLKLTSGRNSLQSDGVNQSFWLQRLSFFIAGLAKSCPKMDLENIMVFTVKNMHKNYNLSIPILKELISRVGGIQNLNNISWKQLQMLNSGPALQRIARSLILDTRHNTLAPALALTRLLMKMKCISELIVLLCKIQIVTKSSNIHYKILSTKCDDSNSLLWTFVEMLKHTLTREEFVEHILSFDKLIMKYGISSEWAFNIWREYFDDSIHQDKESMIQIDKMLENTEFKTVSFEFLSKKLYTDFWKLSLYNVQFNKQLYDDVTTQLNFKLTRVKAQRENNAIKKDIQEVMSNCLSHQKAYKNMQELLENAKNSWKIESNPDVIKAFFQFCILPRAVFTPSDAVFSALFIIEAFGIMETFVLFTFLVESHVLGGLLFSCTVNESANLGMFFNVLLGTFEKSRSNSSLPNDTLAKLFSLHTILIDDLILLLLERNYMSIRNAIEFLNQMSAAFPVVDDHITQILRILEFKLHDKEREDVKLLCTALIGHLKNKLKSACKRQDFVDLSEEELNEIKNKEAEIIKIREYRNALSKDDESNAYKQSKQTALSSGTEQSVETKISSRYNVLFNDVATKELGKKNKSLELIPTISFQVQKTMDIIDSVLDLLTTANFEEIAKLIKDFFYRNELHQALNDNKTDLDSFRKRIANILLNYFYSITKWPQSQPAFLRKARHLETACLTWTPPTTNSSKTKITADDLYGEDFVTKKSTPKEIRLQRDSKSLDDNVFANASKNKSDRFDSSSRDIGRVSSRFSDVESKLQKQKKNDKHPSTSRFNNSKALTPINPVADTPDPKGLSTTLRDRFALRFDVKHKQSRFSGTVQEQSRFQGSSSKIQDVSAENRFHNASKEPSRKRSTNDSRYSGDFKRQRQEDDKKLNQNTDKRLESYSKVPLGPKKSGVHRFK